MLENHGKSANCLIYRRVEQPGARAGQRCKSSTSRSSSRRITTGKATSSSGGRPGSLELDGLPLRHRARTAPHAQGARRERRDRGRRLRRDEHPRSRSSKIAARIKQPGHAGIVCLVGVQSNQFPRAMAHRARSSAPRASRSRSAASTSSGCISMLKELTPELKEAIDLGITLFAGEAEEQFEPFLQDVHAGKAKPLYNYMHDLPNLQGRRSPICRAARAALRRRAVVVRRRPRLPVPMLLLHHHQRPGPQVALARRRRHRAHRPRERRAGHLRGSSSPTTISPATRTGSRSSTG